MNPSDAMPKDYQMYYDNCWMRHSKLGIGLVRVTSEGLKMENLKGKETIRTVSPRYLTCWWPRPGAFNYNDHAIYIARRAVRNMRKSAMSNDHYFVKWGSPYGKEMMMLLRDGPNPKTFREATKLLDTKKSISVAITRDIIVHKEDEEINNDIYTVVFRGIEMGRLVHGSFESLFSNNPLTGRVLRQLEDAL